MKSVLRSGERKRELERDSEREWWQNTETDMAPRVGRGHGGRGEGGEGEGVLDYREKIAKRSEEHSRRPARTAEKARDKRKEPLPTPSRKMKLLSSDAKK